MIYFYSKLKNMRLTPRLVMVYGVFFLVLITVIVSIIFVSVRGIIVKNIEGELHNSSYLINYLVTTALDSSIKNSLRATAENSVDIVEYQYNLFMKGAITEEEAKRRCFEFFKLFQIGKTGYIYVLSSDGVLLYHPSEVLNSSNISEYSFVQTQVEEKVGYIEYSWQNPDELTEREKALYMEYFEYWDWIISVSSYRDEFSDLVKLEDIEDRVTSIKFGETGYPILIDTDGTFLIHPSLKGVNVTTETSQQSDVIKRVIREKNGIIEYDWKNPNDLRFKKKITVYSEIKDYKWLIAASAYKEEFYGGLNKVTFVTLITLVLGLVILFLVTLRISRMVIKPVKKLEKVVLEGVKGDLSVRYLIDGRDEINELGKHFNCFIETLEENNIHLQEEIRRRKIIAAELKYNGPKSLTHL